MINVGGFVMHLQTEIRFKEQEFSDLQNRI